MRPGTRVLMVEDDRYKAELVTMEPEHRGLDPEAGEAGLGRIVEAAHDGREAFEVGLPEDPAQHRVGFERTGRRTMKLTRRRWEAGQAAAADPARRRAPAA